MFTNCQNVKIFGGSFNQVNGNYIHQPVHNTTHNVNSNNVMGNTFHNTHNNQSRRFYGGSRLEGGEQGNVEWQDRQRIEDDHRRQYTYPNNHPYSSNRANDDRQLGYGQEGSTPWGSTRSLPVPPQHQNTSPSFGRFPPSPPVSERTQTFRGTAFTSRSTATFSPDVDIRPMSALERDQMDQMTNRLRSGAYEREALESLRMGDPLPQVIVPTFGASTNAMDDTDSDSDSDDSEHGMGTRMPGGPQRAKSPPVQQMASMSLNGASSSASTEGTYSPKSIPSRTQSSNGIPPQPSPPPSRNFNGGDTRFLRTVEQHIAQSVLTGQNQMHQNGLAPNFPPLFSPPPFQPGSSHTTVTPGGDVVDVSERSTVYNYGLSGIVANNTINTTNNNFDLSGKDAAKAPPEVNVVPPQENTEPSEESSSKKKKKKSKSRFSFKYGLE